METHGTATKDFTFKMNVFDIDGVITIGLLPTKNDIIITGRSFEEKKETVVMLDKLGLKGIPIHFNPLRYHEKTRETSGLHKVQVLKTLAHIGIRPKLFFEDDPIQCDIIEKEFPFITVVRIIHNITNKENERHLEWVK